MKKRQLSYLAIFILGSISQTGFCAQNTKTDKKQWQVYQSTVSFCPFRFEYPQELGQSEERGLDETWGSYELFKMIVWMPEVLDSETHPIQLGLGVRIYKKPNKAGEDTDLLLPGTPCSDTFPFDWSSSTSTTFQGFKVEEYRDCDGVYLGGEGPHPNPTDIFPHEILVRLIDLPTCTVKFTLEMPIIFEKDYYKKDEYLPAKDTAKLKKKKKDIRSKLTRTLNSFKYLGPATKPKKQSP